MMRIFKLIALVPFVVLGLFMMFGALSMLPWYADLGAVLMFSTVAFFVIRHKRRSLSGGTPEGRDPWSRKSEVINW